MVTMGMEMMSKFRSLKLSASKAQSGRYDHLGDRYLLPSDFLGSALQSASQQTLYLTKQTLITVRFLNWKFLHVKAEQSLSEHYFYLSKRAKHF